MATNPRQALIEQIGSFALDPLGFVHFAFPWGEAGTELADATGPRVWQSALLAELGRRLRAGYDIGDLVPILMARASGHGVGKSTVAAWVILWGLSTMPNTRIVVTANTDSQLRTKTWPEVTKWLRLMINREWFKATATAVFSVQAERERLWRADANGLLWLAGQSRCARPKPLALATPNNSTVTGGRRTAGFRLFRRLQRGRRWVPTA
jgi:hypothetical protein